MGFPGFSFFWGFLAVLQAPASKAKTITSQKICFLIAER
jgi:hypothetical protein